MFFATIRPMIPDTMPVRGGAAAIAVLQIWANEENTTEDVRENAIDALCWLHAGQDQVIRDVIGVGLAGGDGGRLRDWDGSERSCFLGTDADAAPQVQP